MKWSLMLSIAIGAATSVQAAHDSLTVYSARKEHLIKPVIEAFRAETGIAVELLTDSEGALLERLKAEGSKTPADLFITVDAGNLWAAGEAGVLQSYASTKIDSAIPSHLRDPKHLWVGLSVRARTIVYHEGKVTPSELSTYEDLAQPKWKGKLCLRTAKKVYNQSLVAMMLAEHGEPATEKLISGWVKNLAAPVFDSDDAVIEAIAAGQCDVGIVNSYYLGRIQKQRPKFPVKIFWASQKKGESGVHVNVSGAGLVKGSQKVAQGTKLLEWLASERGQKLFSSLNLEFPANPKASWDPLLIGWGKYSASQWPVTEAGIRQVAAIKLMDRAGYR